MQKKIYYFSSKDFKNYMKSIGFTSFSYNRMFETIENIENSDFAVISIGNVEILDNIDNDTDLWANGVNNHWLPNTTNVLNLEFADVDNSGNFKYSDAFTNEQAILLFKFIKNNIEKNNFYIHCGAGISRSGAVAAFIFDYFKSNNINAKISPNYPTTPNYWVKKLLMKYL